MGPENDLFAYIKRLLKEHEHHVLKYEHCLRVIGPSIDRNVQLQLDRLNGILKIHFGQGAICL